MARPIVHIVCVGAVYIDTIWAYVPSLTSANLRHCSDSCPEQEPAHPHTFPCHSLVSSKRREYILAALLLLSNPTGGAELLSCKLTTYRVPDFPKEDSKVRADRVEVRRGGNCANTLEVLWDILSQSPDLDKPEMPIPSLYLIASLPEPGSKDHRVIKATLPGVQCSALCRDGYQVAAYSTIILSKNTGTRTIISHGSGLPEMTSSEFFDALDPLTNYNDPGRRLWIHFEGRIPDVTLQCVQQLRARKIQGGLMISVECEKPERALMAQVALHANVVFYSKLWVEVSLPSLNEKYTEMLTVYSMLDISIRKPSFYPVSTTSNFPKTGQPHPPLLEIF